MAAMARDSEDRERAETDVRPAGERNMPLRGATHRFGCCQWRSSRLAEASRTPTRVPADRSTSPSRVSDATYRGYMASATSIAAILHRGGEAVGLLPDKRLLLGILQERPDALLRRACEAGRNELGATAASGCNTTPTISRGNLLALIFVLASSAILLHRWVRGASAQPGVG